MRDCLADLAEHAELLLDRKVFRPLCAENWLYGVHFMDRVFGAEVRCRDGLFWSFGVENEIGELPVPDLEHDPTWSAARRLALALVGFGAKVPFISTQVLGEPWNQTFNLYKERALVGFFDDPEGMQRDLNVVTDTLMEMHRWFLAHIPADQFQPILPEGRCQPRGYGQMCGCSTHLISNSIYEEFVRDKDERILSLYPRGGMLHLSWNEMPIRAMQVNDTAADELEQYLSGTRPDVILYFNPTSAISGDDALRMAGGGKRLIVVEW